MPAASAASTLTSSSPAAAADARRAVVLTASPSAVKSSTVPSGPVGPTYAIPVWIPAPIGIDPIGVASARPARATSSVAAAIPAAAWRGPLIPPKKSPMTSSPTSLSMIPPLSRIAAEPSR